MKEMRSVCRNSLAGRWSRRYSFPKLYRISSCIFRKQKDGTEICFGAGFKVDKESCV